MKRVLATLSLAVVLILFGVVLTRRLRQPEPPLAPELAFARPGVAEVHNPGKAETIDVFDARGHTVARTRAYGRPRAEVRFAWQPGATYRVVADDGASSTARAPEASAELVVRLHAPLGQTPHEFTLRKMGTGPLFSLQEPRRGEPSSQNRRLSPSSPFFQKRAASPFSVAVPAAPGETIDVMLEIEKLTDGERFEFGVSSEIDEEDSGALRMEPPIEEAGEALESEFDKRIWTSRVRLGDRLPGAPLVITLESGELVLPLAIRFVSRAIDREGLRVVAWRLPTEHDGFHERERVADRIILPNRVGVRVASWLNVRLSVPSPYEPFTYQTLWLRNDTAQPISLLLVSEILDPTGGQPVEFFAAPEFESTGGTGRIMAYAHVGPGQTQPCPLPVYVRAETPEGTYLRRIKIKPLGSDRTLEVLEAPLGVVRSDLLFSGWLLGATVLSLAWLAATLVLYRRMVESLGIRVLVLLALLGSLQFCLQFMGGLVSMVFYALLGPFNCLVGGLLTEVMTYLLVTSILFLVPRVGAMTLAGLVTYVMGGVLFGSFGLTDVIFVGSSIAFRETLLLAFGVTRFTSARAKPPRLLPMMLALGLADAAGTFTSLALQAVFYRLFFAGWYVFLQVAVTGFFYTAIGVYLGKSLGMSLRRVHQ